MEEETKDIETKYGLMKYVTIKSTQEDIDNFYKLIAKLIIETA